MLKFNFLVGETEIHEIEFKFNQFWGNTYIMVDGEKIKRNLLFISLSLTKIYEFNVGINEEYHIKIELTRKLLFAGLREYIGKIYVDENLLYEFKGGLSLNDVLLR